jgi:hypothetical protein
MLCLWTSHTDTETEVIMGKRHKWIFKSQGTEIFHNQETDQLIRRCYSQYKCEYCGLQKRFWERESERSFGGTTLDEYILINGEWKRLYENGFKMPECRRRI